MDTVSRVTRRVCVNWQQLSRTATMTLRLSQLRRSMCKASCPDIDDTVRTVGTYMMATSSFGVVHDGSTTHPASCLTL